MGIKIVRCDSSQWDQISRRDGELIKIYKYNCFECVMKISNTEETGMYEKGHFKEEDIDISEKVRNEAYNGIS